PPLRKIPKEIRTAQSLQVMTSHPSSLRLLAASLILPATFALAQPEGRGRGGRAGATGTETTTATATVSTEAKKDEPKKDEKEPVLSVTEHTISIGGKVIKYKATAGYMAMKDAKT